MRSDKGFQKIDNSFFVKLIYFTYKTNYYYSRQGVFEARCQGIIRIKHIKVLTIKSIYGIKHLRALAIENVDGIKNHSGLTL